MHRRLLSTTALGLLGACNVDTVGKQPQLVPHCVDLQGDATCRAATPSRPFCNVCVPASQFQGCVAQLPAPSCSPEGLSAADTNVDPSDDSGTTSDVGTSTSTGGESSSGPVADSSGSTTGTPLLSCNEEGQLDEDCEVVDPARAYCVNEVCTGCVAGGGDAFCGLVDARTPYCNPTTDRCESCGAGGDGFCQGDTPVCDPSGTCVPCTEHDDCETACHLAPGDPLQGECFPADTVVYVSAAAACPGDGSMATPACSLAATLAAVPEDASVTVRLAGGVAYAENVVFTGGTVAIRGTGLVQITGANGVDAPNLEVAGGIMYVDGVRVRNNLLTHGATCSDATLWLDDSELRNNVDHGLFNVGPCDVTLRRSSVHNNPGGGIRQLGGTLVLQNAAVDENGDGVHGPGINLQYAELHALYSTIAGNDAIGDDNLQCLSATGDVRNSIMSGLSTGSIDIDCFTLDFDTNALDTANFVGAGSVLVGAYDENWFVNPNEGDMRLDDGPSSPFGDVALWLDGDPPLDVDGTARPMGGELGYAGVDEP